MTKDSDENLAPLIREINKGFKKPIELFNKLMALELITDPPLIPRIIVLGNKDAGKNGIVGRLLGIPLVSEIPVPLHINFSNGGGEKKMVLKYSNGGGQGAEELDSVVDDEAGLDGKLVDAAKNMNADSVITLTVMHPFASSLSVVVLPGIPSGAAVIQTIEKLDVMTGYILKYTKSLNKNCLFLEVLCAPVDTESLVSRRFDMTGRRTITVLTQLEACSDSQVIKITSRKVINPYGYLFLEDIIGEDNKSKSAAAKEVKKPERSSEGVDELQQSVFTRISKSFVGFDALAKNLVNGMVSIIFASESLILEKIRLDIEATSMKIKEYDEKFTSLSEALPFLSSVVVAASKTLYKLFITHQFDEYQTELNMHSGDVLASSFRSFYQELLDPMIHKKDVFLQYEYDLVRGKDWYIPTDVYFSSAIKPALKKLISDASPIIDVFTSTIFDYISWVVEVVVLDHAEHKPNLHPPLRRFATVVVNEMKMSFVKEVNKNLEREKKFLYTSNPGFISKWDRLKAVELKQDDIKNKVVEIEGLGEVEVGHLENFIVDKWNDAFRIKMVLVSYWEFFVSRFVDDFVYRLMSLLDEMMSQGIEAAMKEYFKVSSEDGQTSNLLDEEDRSVLLNRINLNNRSEDLIKVTADIQKLQETFRYLRC